jgi:uncharacterized protein YcfL
MKTPTTLTLLFLVATALMAVTGCRSTAVNTVAPADKAGQTQMISDERVLTDQTLNNIVRIVGVNTTTGAEGFLKVQVQVQNRTRKARSFSYRVEWFDENGMIIDLPTAVARPRTIEAQEQIAITATAPTPRAKDFRMKFIEPTTK